MASQNDIDLVKINTLEDKYPAFSDDEIGKMLDANKQSVPLVSYKICILKSDSTAISLGPISLENNTDFWKNLAQMYYNEWQDEKNSQEDANYGGTIYMKRADEIWPRM